MHGGGIDLGNPVANHPLNDGLVSWWMGLPNAGQGQVLRNLTGRAGINLAGYSLTNYDGFPAITFSSSSSRTGSVSGDIPLHGTLHAVEIITRTPSASNTYACDFGFDDSAGNGNRRAIIFGYQTNAFNVFNNSAYPTGNSADTQIAYAGADVWQQIVYTSDGSTLRGYRNGVQMLSVSANLNLTSRNYQHDVGRPYAHAGSYYSGTIQSEKIYARFLTDSDVFALYEQWRRGFPDTLRRIPTRRWSFADLVTTTYTQKRFRFRNDDGSETTATWNAAEDTNISLAKLTPKRLRIQTEVTGAITDRKKLQYRKVGASTWKNVS